MNIAIIGTSEHTGGYVRMMAFKNFLELKNNNVDIYKIPDDFFSKLWYYYQSAYSKLKDYEIRLMNKIADALESKLKKKNYDVVICFETKYSLILTRKMNGLKIFCCEAPVADELYFSSKININRIKNVKQIEINIMKNSDYVIFPWETTENYVRKYVWNGDNLITIKYGCYPKNKTVKYFFPTSIVYLGSIKYYWSNKELLSYLTKISPYKIDVYGINKPESKYNINYKGYAQSLDILYNYQYGLNTISKDILRKKHFSSKLLCYLSYGLPVLYPEWQLFPNELKGCISYNENNFLDKIEKYSDIDEWYKISNDAIEQGRLLDWNITLKPLEKII